MAAGRNNAGGGPGGERDATPTFVPVVGRSVCSNTTRSERAQDERSAGRPPLQMKGRPLTLRTCSASEQHSVGPPQRRARPSRLKGVLEARGAAGLEQGVALRRLQLDELDLSSECRDLRGHQILRRVCAESSRRPPRHRRDACSIRLRHRREMTAPDALVDFHTDSDGGLVFQLLRRSRLAPIGKRRHSAFVVLDHGARLVDLLLLFCEGSYELDAAARATSGYRTRLPPRHRADATTGTNRRDHQHDAAAMA